MATVINMSDFKACRLLREIEARNKIKADSLAKMRKDLLPVKPSDLWG